MDEYPKEISLKSGQNLTIRLLKEDDIEALVQFFQELPEEDRMYLRSDVMKRENIVRRFGTLNYDQVYPVIALDRDRIVAIGNLWRAEFGWMRNLGEIRVVVAKDYQSPSSGSQGLPEKRLMYDPDPGNFFPCTNHRPLQDPGRVNGGSGGRPQCF
jgi:hypothetical protein